MTNQLHPADNFKQTDEWPDPTPEMLETVLFDTIWRTIKTWDVNVPHAYSGYMGATGNHARAIYEAIAPLLAHPCDRNDVIEECTKVAQLEAANAKLEARCEKLAGAVLAVVEATRAHLPPGGIDAQECLNRIIDATDNPEINPIISEIENGVER